MPKSEQRLEEGLKKQDLSRKDFLKHAFEWKEKYGDIIYHQIENWAAV